MARQARAALADMRAMEEQKERMNPVNPKKEIAGAGATPSMGLSQFRGGKSKKMAPPAHDSDSEDECECAGKMLAEHVAKMHGGAYLEKFVRGMGKAMLGKEGHGVRGGINTGRYEGEGKKEDVIEHVGAGMNIVGPGYEAVVGAGKNRDEILSKLVCEHGMTVDKATKYVKKHGVKSLSEYIIGDDVKTKKKRAPAAPSDARKKRGAIVSKLMKEHGMTLGEASKYVKEHGVESLSEYILGDK
jgi:hypothetical protein